MMTELRRRLLMFRENLSFKELFVDDPLIPESKARTVESVIAEIGFNPHTAFNNAPISINKMKKCCLIALAKDTPNLSSFRINRFNQTMAVFENSAQVLIASTYPITYNWISADSTKYIVLYGNMASWAEDSPRILKVKWMVLGNVKFSAFSSFFQYDFGVSYYRDDSLGGNQPCAMIGHNYSGGGQLRFPDSLEYITADWLRNCTYSGITSYRIPSCFKGYKNKPFSFYISSVPKIEYIHFLGTIEDWLRVDMDSGDNYVPYTKCFGNGKAVLKCGDNYESPTTAIFPADINTIGARVLDSLPQFTEIHIPANVQIIKNRAFINTINADIYVDKTLEEYKQISFGLYWHNMDTTRDLYLQNQKITEIAINSDEELKGDYKSPFESFSIERLIISDAVTIIPINAFKRCNLKEINWGTGLTKISDYAFLAGFSSELKVLDIPEGVTTIGSQAFNYCKPEEVVIPASCTSVGMQAFANNFPLKITILNPETKFARFPFVPLRYSPNWEIHFNGTLTQFCNLKNVDELGCKRLYLQGNLVSGEIVIPAEATLRYAVFENSQDITKVVIQEGVTSIGQNAFYNCRYVEEIDLPSTITSFGNECFGAMGANAETFKCTFRWTEASKILPPGNTYLKRGNKSTLYVPQGMTQAYRDAGYTEALWPNMVEY